MKKLFCSLGLIVSLYGMEGAVASEYVPGRILVKPKSGISSGDLSTVMRNNGCSELRRIDKIQSRILLVPAKAQVRIIENLKKAESSRWSSRTTGRKPSCFPMIRFTARSNGTSRK
jgi:hypothetical protein